MTFSNKAKFPVRSFNQEMSIGWVRLTTNNTDAPTITVNGGGLIDEDVAITDNGVGDFTLTLKPRFYYLNAWANMGEAGYYCSCTCTGGNSSANTIQLEIFLGAAGATAAADSTGDVIDLFIVGVTREEQAATS